MKGEINYPLLRKVEFVDLSYEDEKKLNNIIQDIYKISALEKPPEKSNRKICKKCSYFELCYA